MKFVDNLGLAYTPEQVISDIVNMNSLDIIGELETLKEKQRILEKLLGIMLSNSTLKVQQSIAKEFGYSLK